MSTISMATSPTAALAGMTCTIAIMKLSVKSHGRVAIRQAMAWLAFEAKIATRSVLHEPNGTYDTYDRG
jgi:hypothetical protein